MSLLKKEEVHQELDAKQKADGSVLQSHSHGVNLISQRVSQSMKKKKKAEWKAQSESMLEDGRDCFCASLAVRHAA